MQERTIKYLTRLSLFLIVFTLTSCASTPEKINMKINLITVDSNNEPIDALCTIYSASNKLDTLAPTETFFYTECSSINVLCKSGELRGENGVIEDSGSESADMVVNTGLGYLFDRAVDSITPMGQMLNLFSADTPCETTIHKIKVVLE